MNMIEKVVKVIADLEGCSVECSHCQKIAKKAIEAMLEPTEEMIVVACEQKIGLFDWNKIIKAALKE